MASTQPNLNQCGHLGSESVDGRALSLSTSQINKLRKKKSYTLKPLLPLILVDCLPWLSSRTAPAFPLLRRGQAGAIWCYQANKTLRGSFSFPQVQKKGFLFLSFPCPLQGRVDFVQTSNSYYLQAETKMTERQVLDFFFLEETKAHWKTECKS